MNTTFLDSLMLFEISSTLDSPFGTKTVDYWCNFNYQEMVYYYYMVTENADLCLLFPCLFHVIYISLIAKPVRRMCVCVAIYFPGDPYPSVVCWDVVVPQRPVLLGADDGGGADPAGDRGLHRHHRAPPPRQGPPGAGRRRGLRYARRFRLAIQVSVTSALVTVCSTWFLYAD